MFAYCNNNPVNYFDFCGESSCRVVGIGFTADFTSDNGTCGGEVVIYFDEEVIRNASPNGSNNSDKSYVVAAYGYSGISFSTDNIICPENTALLIAALSSGDIDLSCLNESNCDELLFVLNALLTGDAEYSGGVFVIFGNDTFDSPSSYGGPFDCYSVMVRKPGSNFGISGFVSTSSSCTAYGIKVTATLGMYFSPVSVSYSKTYYSNPAIFA